MSAAALLAPTHYHRVKAGRRLGVYEHPILAEIDAALRGGTWIPCRCAHGADEIARRHENHTLALRRELREEAS